MRKIKIKKNYLSILLVSLLALPVIVSAQTNYPGDSCPGCGGDGGYGFGGMGGMMGNGWLGYGIAGAIISIIFWVFIIGAIIYLVRYLVYGSDWRKYNDMRHRDYRDRNYPNRERDNRDMDAYEILKRRYASGEITKEEYDRMKADLRD